jgi:N utilization substance protein B
MPVTNRRTERRARARAIQGLYAWDVRGQSGSLEQTAMRVWDDLGVAPVVRAMAVRHVRRVADGLAERDAQLLDVTDNWRMERLGAIERCVLRLAAAELAAGETPPRVVLQEAVRLAERFGTEQSARFVNGVLDAFARRAGRL